MRPECNAAQLKLRMEKKGVGEGVVCFKNTGDKPHLCQENQEVKNIHKHTPAHCK